LKETVSILTVTLGIGLLLATPTASTASNLGSAKAGLEADSQNALNNDMGPSSTGPLSCANGPCGRRSLPDFGDRISVPEPGTLSLVGLGLAAMALVRRRKRTNN